MSDVQDLIARLRGFCPNPYSGQEAADALEAQAAEIERLTAVAAANKAAAEGEARNCDEAVARADALEAERDALRGAQSTALSLLDEIIRDCNNTGLPNEIVADRVIERVEGWAMEARVALGGQQ